MTHYKRRGMPFFPLLAIALLLLMGAVVMWLWNAILPELLAVNRIGYWQAVGLLLLSRILFGNFRRGGGGYGEGGAPSHRRHHNPWREKWKNMTPEEREELKAKWRERCRRRE